MLTRMIIHWLKSFVVRYQLMAFNLIIGSLLSVSLFLAFLQSHHEYYLDFLMALVSTETLIVSLFLTYQLLKSIRVNDPSEEEMKLFAHLVINKNRLMVANLFAAVVAGVFLFFAYLRTNEDFYLDLLQGLVGLEGVLFSVYFGLKLRKTWLSEFELTVKTERLNRFTELMEEAILIREGDYIVEVNDVLARMLGYEVSEMVGEKVFKFMDPQSSQKNIEWMRKGYPKDKFELVARRKDGTTFPLLVQGKNIIYKGRPMRLSCGWDISELKNMQETLLKSEDRFRNFAEVTREGILIHDRGVIVDVNQALTDMVGMAPSDFIGKDSLFFLDERSAQAVKDFRSGLLPALPYEITLIHADGSLIPCETYATDILWQGREMRSVRIWNVTERKRIEKALVESQERFKRFAEVTKEGILIHDKGFILDVNQAILDMLGCEAGEVIGKNNFVFMDEPSKKKVMKFREDGYTSDPYEVSLIRKDGTLLPVEVNGVSFSWGGKELRVVRIWDMTSRKKIEEDLRKSEESFRNLIEKSPDAMSIHTTEKTVYVNEALLKMLGYASAEELVGQVPEFFVHPEDAAKVRERISKLKNPGDYNPPAERRFVRKDGTIVWVDVVSFLIYFEGIPMKVAVSRDQTEKRKAQEALKQSERNFRNLIEKSPDGVIIHTLDDYPKIVYVNDAMVKFVGYPAGELIGQKADFFAHAKDAPGIRKRIERLKSQGDYNPPQEKLFVRKDGIVVHAEAVSFLIHYEGVSMAAVVARDLTERKKAEETMMKLERLSTIGEMSAGMAHEIRNPLAAISTAAQILLRKKIKENSGQLETILEQSDRLEKLVRDTLDYAKTSVEPIRKSFSVKSALESALNLSQIQFGPSHKKVKIHWELPPKDIEINADSGRIQQIFVNLILNAFQIMSGAGELRLELKSDDEFAWVRVEDNGPGITEENMKRVFEPFFTTKDNGSGLGLAISQRIAQEHGGQIMVEGVKPKGAAFILRLPIGGKK